MTRLSTALFAPTLATTFAAASLACTITDGNTASDTDAPTSATEGTDGMSGTSAGPGTDTTPMGDEVTIPMIRQGMVAPDTVVTVKDAIVTAPVRVYGGEDQYAQYYIGDPAGGEWSGIYLFTFSDLGLQLNVGDQVTVTATYEEYNGVSQLSVNSLESVSVTGTATPPAPVVVPAATLAGDATGEPYESVVVRVENVEVTDDSQGFGNYVLSDGLTLNNQYLFAAGEQFQPVNGDTFGALIGPLARNTYDPPFFYIAPRTWDDVIDWDSGGNPTTTTDTDTTGPSEDATVYQVQMGDVPEGNTVTIKNVVVSSPLTFAGNNMYVQEQDGGAWSGINVFLPNGAPALAVGDVVDITGTYEEFFDNSQIVVQDMADIVPTGGTAPVVPEVLTPADCLLEDWEGVLATVENVTVTVEGMEMYWEWEVDGLTMDKQFIANDDWPKPTVGTTYSSLTGPLRFAFEKRRMSPRDLNDIVE